jgi:hypothetical protein
VWLFFMGLGHAESRATSERGRAFFPCWLLADDFQSRVAAVGHEVRSHSGVRCAEAASRGTNRPDGKGVVFQVSTNKIEPSFCDTVCNLFAKDNVRAALLDEPIPGGPKVPLVIKPFSFACEAERLARARAGPDGAIVGPTGEPQGIRPDTNAGEEVTLDKSVEV